MTNFVVTVVKTSFVITAVMTSFVVTAVTMNFVVTVIVSTKLVGCYKNLAFTFINCFMLGCTKFTSAIAWWETRVRAQSGEIIEGFTPIFGGFGPFFMVSGSTSLKELKNALKS